MTKILAALLLTGKMGKFLLTGGSMLLSVFTYALIYGWQYACGFVALLFMHEMGHYLAARQSGLDVGAPCFIPFVGAWINLKEQPLSAEVEAYIGIAGPVVGSIAAFICYLLAQSFESRTLLAIAYSGFVLNLFNLIPLSPLDGGRIVSVISPRLWYVGIPLLGLVFLWQPSPLLLLIALLAIPQIMRLRKGDDSLPPRYYETDINTRISYGVQYLILVIALAVSALELHEQLRGIAG